MRKVADIEICVDCLVVVDGDPLMGDGESQARAAVAAEGLAANWPGMQVHAAGSGACDGWFSRSSCDGCGNTDGGERHPAVVLAPEVTVRDWLHVAHRQD